MSSCVAGTSVASLQAFGVVVRTEAPPVDLGTKWINKKNLLILLDIMLLGYHMI